MLRLTNNNTEINKTINNKVNEVNVKVEANANAIANNSKSITDIKANVANINNK